MTLYDFIRMEDTDFDTYDTVFDAEVTVCVPYDDSEITEWYDKFYNFIIKHVEFKEKISEYECTAEWTNFITDNLEIFREAANDMWYDDRVPDDNDDLIYEWIKEIHSWLAGYVSEAEYQKFMEKYAPRMED